MQGAKMRAEIMKEVLVGQSIHDVHNTAHITVPAQKRIVSSAGSAAALNKLATDVDAERAVIDTLTAKIKSLQAMQDFQPPPTQSMTSPATPSPTTAPPAPSQ